MHDQSNTFPCIPRKSPERPPKDSAGWEEEYGQRLYGFIPHESNQRLLAFGIRHHDINPDQVVMQFGSWVVTDYGMECLNNYYPIKKDRLHERYWISHMLEKRWVMREDFLHCFEAAQWHHRVRSVPMPHDLPEMSIGRRFDILKRDGYRCQICGRKATDGVRIEVDHKIPRSKGGSSEDGNLWACCFECNHGKRDKDL